MVEFLSAYGRSVDKANPIRSEHFDSSSSSAAVTTAFDWAIAWWRARKPRGATGGNQLGSTGGDIAVP